MNRAEIAESVRDLLEESSTAVLSPDRLARAVNRVLKDFTSRTHCLSHFLQLAAAANNFEVSVPAAAVGIAEVGTDPINVTLTVKTGTGNDYFSYTWSTQLTGPHLAERYTAVCAENFAANYPYADTDVYLKRYKSWLIFTARKGFFTQFSTSDSTKVAVYTIMADPLGVEEVFFQTGTGIPKRLKKIDKRAFDKLARQPAVHPASGIPSCYSYVDGVISLYPVPSSSGWITASVSFEHPSYPTDSSWDTVPFLIDDSYANAISLGTAAECSLILREREGTSQMFTLFRSDYERLVGKYIQEQTSKARIGSVLSEVGVSCESPCVLMEE